MPHHSFSRHFQNLIAGSDSCSMLTGCHVRDSALRQRLRAMKMACYDNDEDVTASDSPDQQPLSMDGPLKCPYYADDLLRNPYYNKGSAFTVREREAFNLHGLLPPSIQSLESQLKRAYQQYSSRENALAKNTFMTSLKDQNSVLFYRLIFDHLKEMFPIIYTPTEGDAIENYSRLFRKSNGACFLAVGEPGDVEKKLGKFQGSGLRDRDVDYIVVTDGEEILGLGDCGVGGILISEAKLVLTTLCAGIDPSRTLPVVLDVGTDNEALLNDELYLGVKKPRIRGKEYNAFVEDFVVGARKVYPNAFLHFEDFGVTNARRLLNLYRSKMPCFNDDIQGTGCVTMAAVMAGLQISQVELSQMRMVVFGSGSAGIGIADQVRDIISADTGKSKEEVQKQIWCVDKQGLLLDSDEAGLAEAQRPYARSKSEWKNKNTNKLQEIVKNVKPHVLIGTSTQPRAFSKEIVQEMAKHVDRPIIFPLSNPTRLHEADPKDLNDWTDGRALIATGSPFPPATHNGKKYEVAECNNMLCFPGVALGAVVSRTKLLSDKMLMAAVKALAAQSPALKDPAKELLPDVTEVRDLSLKIAVAVIRAAVDEGLAQHGGIPVDNKELEKWVSGQMWEPTYRELVPLEK